MDDFETRMERMRIRVTSPDGTVRGTLEGAGGEVRVEFAPRSLAGHTEASLAVQLSAMLGAVERAYSRTLAALVEASAGPAVPLEELDPDVREWRERYESAAAKVSVTGHSPNEHVRARITGEAGMEFRIRPGSLDPRRLSEASLAEEINTVIADVRREYGERLREIQFHVHEQEARGER